MPKAKNPEARVMEYFETAPLDAAKVVHSIAKNTLARRSQVPSAAPTQPPMPVQKKARKKPGPKPRAARPAAETTPVMMNSGASAPPDPDAYLS